jgi:hypothetical protein
VKFCPISDILVENKDGVPGCYVQPSGYVVLATTICGDAFRLNTRAASGTTAPVVLIAYDLEPENDETKREDLRKLAKPIAASFEDFLKAFVSDTLDIERLYRPFNFGNAGDMPTMAQRVESS